MTYCVAIRLAEGLLFVSDSRTNAGVDHIATFRKLHLFGTNGARFVGIQTSGNLATSQAVITLLRERLGTGHGDMWAAESMYGVANTVGETLREVVARSGDATVTQGIDLSCSLLVGGQLAGSDMALYNIYPQGNFIKATEDTPYFQIGESKYGKPILDRALKFDTPLRQALRCALISFDSTIRSNLSVGMPLDVAMYTRDSLSLPRGYRITESDAYFQHIRASWSEALSRALASLPEPPSEYDM